jgi:RimJ/RimL family protein N-acetyltransferase
VRSLWLPHSGPTGPRRVGWSTSLENAASRAVARKLGFREVARNDLWLEGAPIATEGG